jgi:hypothetical protein
VSASNIPLEEEEEEEGDYHDLCRELLVFAPQDSRLSSAISKYSPFFTLNKRNIILSVCESELQGVFSILMELKP